MADTYGALALPPPAPPTGEAVADPALQLLANFLAAVLNAQAQTAWATVCPPITGLSSGGSHVIPVVKTVFTHDPDEEVFNETDLPALFLWRGTSREAPAWIAADYRTTSDTWTALWIARPAQQQQRRIRRPFWNGIAKLIDRAIEDCRSPSFVAAGDTDATAADVSATPEGVKLTFVASLVDTTYSGASLDGATGTAVFAPPQQPAVTVTGAGSGTIEFTGLGADGTARTSRVDIGANDTFTGDWMLTQVTSVDVPAQSPGVILALGLAGWTGLGTNVVSLGEFQELSLAKWAPRTLTIEMSDKSPPRSYEALELTFRVDERWVRDPGDDATAAGLQFTSSSDNSSVLAEEALD